MRASWIIILSFTLTCLTAQTYDPGNFFASTAVTYNPAATGTEDAFTMLLSHRNKWTGLDGAPLNTSFSLHTPTLKNNQAFGTNVDAFSIGNQHYYSLNFNYAYRLFFGENKLSLGLKGGLISYSESELYLASTDVDPLFSESQSFLMPNVGLGFLLHSKKYFVGISIPYLLAYDYTEQAVKANDAGNFTVHLSGGYTYEISPILKVHPAVLFKMRSGISSQMHLNLVNVSYRDRFMLGFNYISTKNYESEKMNSFATLVKLGINPQTDLGFAYEYNGGAINAVSNNSLELFISYSFSYKLNVSSPLNF